MKNLMIFVLVFSICVFFTVEASAFQYGKLNIRGTEEGKLFAFQDKTDHDTDLYRGESKLQLNMDYDFNNEISLICIPELYLSSGNLNSNFIDSFRERNERRYILNLEEAYMLYSAEQYDWSIGKRIYSWGVADSYKPMDNLNAYELTDIPDLRKLGIFSASFNYSWPETSINFVVVPFFTPSRLPEKDSRWAESIGPQEGNNALIVGNQFQYSFWAQQLRAFLASYGITFPGLTASTPNTTGEAEKYSAIQPRELPPKQFRNAQYGIRLNTTKGGWDFSLSYYDGFNNVAVMKKDIKTTEVHFIPTYNKMREIGGAFSTTYGQMEIHAEGTCHLTDGNADDDYLEYIGGASYTWDRSDIGICDEIRLFAEYAGQKVINHKTNKDFISYAGYHRPFRNTILGRTMIKVDEYNQFDLSWVWGLSKADHYFQPKFTHKFNDSWKLVSGLDIFTGESNTFFGKWDRNDRFFSFLTYSF
jgi:hypothetical protein